ncbi:MAG: HAMP domain-containing sensor histidine kinase [Candidatus Cloacimonetes bacterium]|nr:HAMP domain-containing histidine kinase [Candidatus Cloacimonadota bacterium]MDD3236022.1 HAMP domain-containing sensor histidine kinase [Candidatus Cloacimonadota bacterium]
MKPALKNLIPTGKKQKNVNLFNRLRIFLIGGSLAIFLFFAGYIQVLIKQAKVEQEFVPRIFAQYIAYTDTYLRAAEQYAQLLTEVSAKYLQFSASWDFQQNLWDYISTEFMPENPIPVIITDPFFEPQMWKNVGVPTDTLFAKLSLDSRKKLERQMTVMIQTPLTDNGEITGYAYYSKPVSFEQFIKNINYSIIVTDRYKQPLFWRNVDIPETANYYQMSTEQQQQLARRIVLMDEIPLSNEADSLGYIYFSTPKSLSYIRYIVLLELILAMMVIFFGSYGLFLLRRTEKDTLWIGLAKETAHQFGTPITSLMGWIDYLKEAPPEGTERNVPQIVEHMTADLNHLRNIASRFGKVGSMTKLEPQDLHQILNQIVEYFSLRMPHLGKRIDIHLISKIEGVKVSLDAELFKWTLENLIKNCVDAMSNKGGNIILTATQKSPWIYILIRDEGKGIPRSQWKRIFDPGVTTKTRGWGLGLSLAKRIIEEYHNGHIKVVQSSPDEGSTFEIKLPAQPIHKEK